LSLAKSDFDKARDEALLSPANPKDTLSALRAVSRIEQLWLASERNAAWASGRKGDGAGKIPGLTDTLTALVRQFAAKGVVRYTDTPDLHRQVSALRKRFAEMNLAVTIDTLIGEGYELTDGFDHLYRLLHQAKLPSLRIEGFTSKQTAILKALAARGSVHVEQIECLQRHMSNIRARLKELGHAKQIKISTEAGVGLYLIDEKSRASLQLLLAGELPNKAAPRRERKKAKRKTKKLAKAMKRAGKRQEQGAALAA
jgi:DNA-binding winged helix-turn-helix (wHTH) protein